jgi:hypothetical protein
MAHGLDAFGSKCLRILTTLVSDIPDVILVQYEQTRQSYGDMSSFLSARYASRGVENKSPSLSLRSNQAAHQPNIRKRLFTDGQQSTNTPTDWRRDPYNLLPALKPTIVHAASIDSDGHEKENNARPLDEWNSFNSVVEVSFCIELMLSAVSDCEARLLCTNDIGTDSALAPPFSVPKVDAEVRRDMNDSTFSELQNCLARMLSLILDQNISSITRKATFLPNKSQVAIHVIFV